MRVPRACRACGSRTVIRFSVELKEGRRFLVARAKCERCGAVYEAMVEIPGVIGVWELGVLEASMVEREKLVDG